MRTLHRKQSLINSPAESRLEAYEYALQLKRKGLTPAEINQILKKRGFNIKYDTLWTWVRGIKSPHGRINFIKRFDEKFAYIIGVILGDGCIYKVMRNGSYMGGRVIFNSKDKELADKVALLLACVLGKRRCYKVIWNEKLQIYVVECWSKHLVEVISKPIEELEDINEKHPIEFLKGLFDAEGSVSIRILSYGIYPRIFLTNSNLKLLLYVKKLLKRFNINSNIHINTPAGKLKTIKNRRTMTKKTCYNISIENIDGAKKFAKLINFTIKRKSKKLNCAIKLINKFGTKGARKYY